MFLKYFWDPWNINTIREQGWNALTSQDCDMHTANVRDCSINLIIVWTWFWRMWFLLHWSVNILCVSNVKNYTTYRWTRSQFGDWENKKRTLEDVHRRYVTWYLWWTKKSLWRSPGFGGIPNELLKYLRQELAKKKTELFNKMIAAFILPTEWKKSITISNSRKKQKSNRRITRELTHSAPAWNCLPA